MPVSSPELSRVRSVPVAVRYDDLGPAGHVNNVASVRIIEEARRTFLGLPVTPGATGVDAGILDHVPASVRHLVRRQDIEYHDELWYQGDPFVVDLWVSTVGTTSFRIQCEVRVSRQAEPAVTAETVMVLADRETGRPWPIPAEIADRLLAGALAVG